MTAPVCPQETSGRQIGIFVGTLVIGGEDKLCSLSSLCPNKAEEGMDRMW